MTYKIQTHTHKTYRYQSDLSFSKKSLILKKTIDKCMLLEMKRKCDSGNTSEEIMKTRAYIKSVTM